MRNNLLDNIVWRGEKDFTSLPFREVDALILSVLIYQRFEDVENYGEGLTLKELYPIVCPLPIELTSGFDTNRYKLWAKVISSKRFSSLTLSRFAYSLSSERQNEEQFGAAVFKGESLPDILIYRGTDESITGWKEDLNLGFEDEIPSERKALSFLEEIANDANSIIMAGHSKGGTLALYSALKAKDSTFNKIERIYSFDAPGLPEEMTESPRWQAVVHKTESYLPSYSIFGVLFNTIPDPKVVKSDGIGVFQHDAFTWRLGEETFIYDKALSPRSRLHGESLRSFFTSSTRKEREILVEAIYKVLGALEENNVFHIPVVIIEHLDLFTKEIASLSKEERDVVKKLLGTIRKARKEGYRKIKEQSNGSSKEKENMA